MNRTRGFVNRNRFKSGKAIKRLDKITHDRRKGKLSGKDRGLEKPPLSYDFGA